MTVKEPLETVKLPTPPEAPISIWPWVTVEVLVLKVFVAFVVIATELGESCAQEREGVAKRQKNANDALNPRRVKLFEITLKRMLFMSIFDL